MSARRKLLESLGAVPAPEPAAPRLAVPPKFVKDFEAVAKHYRLRECGEYETAKAAARADLDAAITTYAAMAKDIAS